MMAGLVSSLRDSRGNMFPLAAIILVVLVTVVGGSVDMSRVYRVQNRLQSACDSGVLAGRRAETTNGYDSASQTQASNYFNVNYDDTVEGTTNSSFTTSTNNNGTLINGVASTRLGMMFMQMFGWNYITLTAKCSSTMGVGNSDITMVLDVTGSMASSLNGTTRIAALKSSMKNFFSTVSASTSGTNARVRYAIVPFSSTVNVGRLLYNLDPSYLRDSMTIQSRTAAFDTLVTYTYGNPTTTTGTPDYTTLADGSQTRLNNTGYGTSSCGNNVPAAGAWTNNGSPSVTSNTTTNGQNQQVVTTTTAQPQSQTNYLCKYSNGLGAYAVYSYSANRTYNTYSIATSNPTGSSTSQTFNHYDYQNVTYDVSQYKRFNAVSVNNGTNGASVPYTWAGCIEERQTVSDPTFTYSSLSGISPSAALDLDIDSAPTSSNATKWAPMWPEVAYYRTNSSGYMTTNATSLYGDTDGVYCVPAAMGMSAVSQSDFNNYADSLTAQGNTYLDIGMLWGARLSSPDGIFSAVTNDTPNNGGKISRHLIFMTDGDMNTAYTTYSSYGIEYHDLRVTDDGSDTQGDARHTSRFRAICDAVKTKGIRIWVIAFTNTLNSDLTYCASTNSAYTASSSTALNAAFQDIAKQVGELRVLQ